MLHKLIKSVLFPLSILPLIGSCSLFPKTKVIEYDEEVKLSDGSMIWVHIKRHYIQTGGREIPNLFQGYEKGWGAKEVEISWDTGFPNVGRKSVFFARQVFLIDRYNDIWYIAGVKNSTNTLKLGNNTINCNSVGVLVGDNGCIITIDKSGNFLNPPSNILDGKRMNILYSIGIKDWGDIPNPLNKRKLSWNEKLNL